MNSDNVNYEGDNVIMSPISVNVDDDLVQIFHGNGKIIDESLCSVNCGHKLVDNIELFINNMNERYNFIEVERILKETIGKYAIMGGSILSCMHTEPFVDLPEFGKSDLDIFTNVYADNFIRYLENNKIPYAEIRTHGDAMIDVTTVSVYFGTFTADEYERYSNKTLYATDEYRTIMTSEKSVHLQFIQIAEDVTYRDVLSDFDLSCCRWMLINDDINNRRHVYATRRALVDIITSSTTIKYDTALNSLMKSYVMSRIKVDEGKDSVCDGWVKSKRRTRVKKYERRGFKLCYDDDYVNVML